MATTLGSLSIGSTVKIKYDGVFTDFIVIHRGNPSTTYYSGTGLTSGTWLIFKDCPEDSGFGSTGNLAKHIGYGSSSIPGLLNTTVLGKLQYGVQNKILSIKKPYSGWVSSSNVKYSGSSNKLFLLNPFELGFSATDMKNLAASYHSTYASYEQTGVQLNYFTTAASRKAIYDGPGSEVDNTYWLTDGAAPNNGTTGTNYDYYFGINASGGLATYKCTIAHGLRPAFVLPNSTSVDNNDGNKININTAPTISGVDGSLGVYNESAPTVNYYINDVDKDNVTVTIALNGTTKETKTVSLGATYSYTPTASEWSSLSYSTHTITITASDGVASITRTYTFNKEKESPLGYSIIEGYAKNLTGGGYVNISGVWRPIAKIYMNVLGVWNSFTGTSIHPVPSNCTRVQYIQSSGTQYMDAEFVASSDTRIVADIETTTSAPTVNKWVFGSRGASGHTNGYELVYISSSSQFRFYFSNNYSTFSGVSLGRLNIDVSKNAATINGVTVTPIATTFTGENNLYIFSCHSTSVSSEAMPMKVYDYRIYEKGDLVKYFIPIIDSSGVACLYDCVDNKFHRNIGTGNFTAGPAIV